MVECRRPWMRAHRAARPQLPGGTLTQNAPTLALALGRVLIAAAWADGALSPTERAALEDLLYSMPGLDGESWRALAADIDRPFPAEHLPVLIDHLQTQIRDEAAREQARTAVEQLADRLGGGTPEAAALHEVLDRIAGDRSANAPGTTADDGWWSRLRGSLRHHAERLVNVGDRERDVERALDARIAATLPDLEALDADALRRLSLAASILAHVVRIDGVVEAGERDALRAALEEQYGLEADIAAVVTELALDEVADGIDLHALLRDFTKVSTEEHRQRFLAAVFRVAAGDGRASLDEIEEVRRIGRGLLLSHRHFIAAKLTLPGQQREI